MEIVSVYNDKGGVGKTAIALQIGSALAVSGKRVLLIDNDPQGSLSVTCAKELSEIKEGMDAFYKGEKELPHVITDTHIENMYLVPAGSNLKDQYQKKDAEIRTKIENISLWMKNNKVFLDLFDIVIIDNPPVQDGVSLLFAKASDRIVIPVIPDEICFDALVRTYTFLEKQCTNFTDKYVVIVPSLVKNRAVHKKYLAVIQEEYQGKNENTIISDVAITDRAEIPDAMGNRQILFISHAASECADQFKRLCMDIFPWLEKQIFYKTIQDIVENKKKTNRDKFKKMIEERQKQRKLTMGNNKTGSKEDVMEVVNG